MEDYYKYLPVSIADEKWGLYVLNAGYTSIKENASYPHPLHPNNYHFSYAKGRVLDEYQIIYITNGTGVFESVSMGHQNITAGTIIFLFPGEWHRFKPNRETGWDEFWVGFKGQIVEALDANHCIHCASAVLPIGVHEEIARLLALIIGLTKEEKSGYQQWAGGIVFHLIGQIHFLNKFGSGGYENTTELIIQKAKIIFRNNTDSEIFMYKIANQLNVSYAWFRKAFKAYTGISPNQYLLQLRIEKAKSLLHTSTLSIKEIADCLHFSSAEHLSKLFKQKTGLPPKKFRSSMMNHVKSTYS